MAVQPLYRNPFTGHIYLFLWNDYWHIKDAATLNGVFGASPVIEEIAFRPHSNREISEGSFVFRQPGTAGVYFMCTGTWKAYPILSMPALQYYQFNGTPLPSGDSVGEKVISFWLANLLPLGEPITGP